MSGISDKLRDYGRRLVSNASPFNCTFGDIRAYQDELADRIDNETVELPRDRDGSPIHVGDTVYLDDGQKAEVISIVLAECASVINCWTYGKSLAYMPSGISHKPADGWERIADELDEMVDASDSADDRCEKLADLAVRIRRLAER